MIPPACRHGQQEPRIKGQCAPANPIKMRLWDTRDISKKESCLQASLAKLFFVLFYFWIYFLLFLPYSFHLASLSFLIEWLVPSSHLLRARHTLILIRWWGLHSRQQRFATPDFFSTLQKNAGRKSKIIKQNKTKKRKRLLVEQERYSFAPCTLQFRLAFIFSFLFLTLAIEPSNIFLFRCVE